MSNANFNNLVPAPPANSTAVSFAKDGSGNISASVPTPLLPANNLSDVGNVSAVLTNLGLGSAATTAASSYDAAGSAAAAQAAAEAYSANASNLSSGTVPPALLPNPTSTTLGGVESIAPVATEFLTGISTSGTPSAAQPAFTDVSGIATLLQIPTIPVSQISGLGTAATTASTAYDSAGAAATAQAASLQKAANLGDLTNPTTARSNLGLTSAATTTPASLTELTSAVLTITGGASALLAATTITVAKATGTVPGYLAAADFATFNSKQNALGFTPASLTTNVFSGIQTFTVAPIFTDQPGSRTALGLGSAATTASTAYDAAGAATAAVAAIPTASATATGLLSSANWSVFNNKQPAITPGSLTESTSSVLTITGGASALLAATTIQVKQATTSTAGYLSSADWNTFNGKQAALGYTPANLTVNTFSGIQTFTVAPVFTDQPNSRLALGLGSSATQPSSSFDAAGAASAAQTAAITASEAYSANASNLTSGTVAAARLPNPSTTTLGGVQAITAVSHSWVSAISTSGVPALSQPAFTDISGTIASGQVPTLNQSTTGTAANVTGIVAIANGGTGQTTAAAALAALGGATSASLAGYASLTASNTFTLSQTVSGATAGWNFLDRSTSLQWTWYATSGAASLYNTTNGNVLNVTVAGAVSMASLALTAALPISSGGTGATTAAGALTNLGAASSASLSGYASLSAANTFSAANSFSSQVTVTGGTGGNLRGSTSFLVVNAGTAAGSVLYLNYDQGTGGVTFGSGAGGVSGASVSAAGAAVFTSMALTTALPIASGGTASTTAAAARTALGITAAGTATPAALTDATSPSVLTITGGSAALLAATSITVAKATGSVAGYLAAADWTAFNAKQAALGYTPLNPANNLSDVANAGTAFTNLGGASLSAANTFTAAQTMSSTLAVTGAATLSSTLSVAGAATFNGSFTVNNQASTTGSVAGWEFLDRTTSLPWVLYATGGNAYIYNNTLGAALTINAAGAIGTVGALSVAGLGSFPNGISITGNNGGWANSTIGADTSSLIINPPAGAIYLCYSRGNAGVNFCNGSSGIVASVSATGVGNFASVTTSTMNALTWFSAGVWFNGTGGHVRGVAGSYLVINSAGSQPLYFNLDTGNAVACYGPFSCNGTITAAGAASFASLTLSAPLPIASGGTGTTVAGVNGTIAIMHTATLSGTLTFTNGIVTHNT